MKFLVYLEKNTTYWILLLISFFFILLRLPSLFEPYWYGDEGIYQVIGMGLSDGRFLYRDIWDNKPPLLYVTYALFSSDQFTIRLVSLVVGLISVISFFFLSQKLFTNISGTFYPQVVYGITGLYALLFAIPLLEGNIANAENFMLLPIMYAGLLVFTTASSLNPYKLLAAGIVLSIAFMFKAVAFFDFLAFSIFLLSVGTLKRNVVQTFFHLIPFAGGFFLPIVSTGVFFLINGAFFDFFTAAFIQNVGYVGYGNRFFIPQGLLLLKLGILFFSIYILIKNRFTLSSSFLFILIWVLFSLFNALFSQRPYTHYLLVLLPSFVLLIGLLLQEFVIIQKTKKIIVRSLFFTGCFLFFILLMIVIKNFDLYKKNVGYYINFYEFLTHKKSLQAYQAFFDANTPTDYELAQYLKMHAKKTDSLFIWGNNAQLYKLVHKLPPGRFTVAYHMTATPKTLEESKQAVLNNRPAFIVITSRHHPIPFRLNGYVPKIVIKNAIVYEYLF